MTTQERQQEITDVFTMMGIALSVLHEIEFHFAAAVFLGITDVDRKKKTVNQMLAERRKMTFGQLLSRLKENWEFEPDGNAFFERFLEERNVLIHELTVSKGYRINLKRDRERLAKRLHNFIQMAKLVRRMLVAAHFTTLDFARYMSEQQGYGFSEGAQLSPEMEREVQIFLRLIKHKGSN